MENNVTPYSMSDDLALLTTIPKKNFDSIFDYETYIICHNMSEQLNDKNKICTIDIGIGTLYIKPSKDEIKYKFVPNQKLDTYVKNTLLTGESALTVTVEEAVKNRILNTYKDLL